MASLLAATGVATAGGHGGNARIRALPSQHALVVDGRIGHAFEPDLRAWLRHYPDTRVVLMHSPGGLRWPALQVAELLNARGITLRVADSCASACALLWAAVDSREMAPGARLGLHRSHLPDPLPLPGFVKRGISAWNDRQTDRILRDAGFSPRLIARRDRTPPTAMSWFDAADLRHEGVPFRVRGGTLRDADRPASDAVRATTSAAIQARSPVAQG